MIVTKGIPDLKESHKWSFEFRDFISQCLRKEVEDRPDAPALLKVLSPSLFFFPSFSSMKVKQKNSTLSCRRCVGVLILFHCKNLLKW